METFSESLNFRSRISTISNSYNFEWFIGLGLFESIIWSLFTFYLKYTTNRVFEYTRSPFKGPKIHVFGQFASYQLDYLTIFWYIIRFTSSFKPIEPETILKLFKVNEVNLIRHLRTSRKRTFLIRNRYRSFRSG